MKIHYISIPVIFGLFFLIDYYFKGNEKVTLFLALLCLILSLVSIKSSFVSLSESISRLKE